MFAPLLFAAAVVSAAPAAPAWEPLACTYCDASEARAIGWSFESADAQTGPSAWENYILPDALRGQRFASQGECLAALRRSLPAVTDQTDDAGQITTRTHNRDHIRETETLPGVQTGTALFGCFQHRAPVG